MKYTVPTSFIFNGHFIVEADSREAAEDLVKQHCALTLGSIHSSLPDKSVDWDFPIYPEKKIIPSKEERNPKVKVGDVVRILQLHHNSNPTVIAQHVGSVGEVMSYYKCQTNDQFCTPHEIIVKGCPVYVIGWELV